MKPMLWARLVVVATCGITLPLSAQASLFDKLKEKAEKAVDDAVDSMSNGDAPADSSAPAPASAANTEAAASDDATGNGQRPTEPIKIGRAILAAEPNLFEGRPEAQLSDHYMKDFVTLFYPEERESIQNEFQWRKNKAAYQERMVAESKDAPTTFEVAPWLNNGSGEKYDASGPPRFAINYQYDFDREAWQFGVENGLQIPWIAAPKYAFVIYEISDFDIENLKNRYLPMSAEAAEKFDQRLKEEGLRLYGRYNFTITDVIVDPKQHPRYEQYKRDLSNLPEDRRNSLIAGNLPPVALITIEDNRIELYAAPSSGDTKSKSAYTFVGTLDVSTGEVVAAN